MNFKDIIKQTFLKYRRIRCEEILVLGDSHVDVFGPRFFRKTFPNVFFNIVSVKGATVSGLENPNSITQALPIFLTEVRKSKSKTIVICLGEVDTGFVIWYRAQKYHSLNIG